MLAGTLRVIENRRRQAVSPVGVLMPVNRAPSFVHPSRRSLEGVLEERDAALAESFVRYSSVLGAWCMHLVTP